MSKPKAITLGPDWDIPPGYSNEAEYRHPLKGEPFIWHGDMIGRAMCDMERAKYFVLKPLPLPNFPEWMVPGHWVAVNGNTLSTIYIYQDKPRRDKDGYLIGCFDRMQWRPEFYKYKHDWQFPIVPTEPPQWQKPEATE